MQPPPKPTLKARVQAALPQLHPSERRLADAILGFPGQLASYSATELAQMAAVSNATVTRFVRKVGFANFEEARQAARDDQLRDAALSRVAGVGIGQDGFTARHLMQAHQNLDHSFAAMSDEMVDGVAQAMIAAPQVFVIGYRAAQPFARYLGWQVLQVLPNVTVLPRDGETLSEVLSSVQSDDCVVLFALRRTPAALAGVTAQLAAQGAKLALVGDAARPGDAPVDWEFACNTTAVGPIFDHVAVMAVCNLIASRVVALSGEDGLARMRRIEELHGALDEL